MNDMSISVIIVSWNAKAYLLQCLESIRAQKHSGPIEVIVVDNASTDGSPEAAAAAYPEVKVLRNRENLGFSRANNIGIRASTGDYLFLINSDVVVGKDCFARMIRFMVEHPEAGIVGPKIFGGNGRLQRSCMGYPSLWNAFCRALALDVALPRARVFGGQLQTYWDHDDTRPVQVINGCFWMLRRSAMDQVGLLDERFLIYGEDIDWCKRFNDKGWKVVFYRDADAVHFGGASSSNAPIKFYLEMQRANYQYWLKHHSRPATYGFLTIGALHHSIRLAGELMLYPFAPARRKASAYKINRGIATMQWIFGTLVATDPKRRLETAERLL